MGAEAGIIELSVRAKLDALEKDLASVKSKALGAADDIGDSVHSRLGSKLSGIGQTIGKATVIGLAAATVGVGAFLKSAVDAGEETRKVLAQTNAVIASTGGAAHVSAEGVGRLADKLSGLTGIDDEVVASTSNMLLTFTNVRNEAGRGNDIFDQATKTALDMSVALGTDSTQAAMQLGKALNDPIKGVSALQRVGVTFTDQQKDQIKTLVESGNVLGAQKVILSELGKEFGGSAEAAASPMARLKVVLGNLQEEVGLRLLPVVGAFATFLANKLPGAMDAVERALRPVIDGVRLLIGSITGAGANVDLGSWTNPIIDAGARIRSVFDQVKATVTDFVIAFRLALSGESFDAETGPQRVAQAIAAAVQFVQDHAVPILIGLGLLLATLVGPWFVLAGAIAWAYTHFQTFHDVVDAVVTTVAALISGFVDLVTTIWTQFGDQIITVAQGAWTAISGVIEGALQVIRGIVEVITAAIHGDWAGVWAGIEDILAGTWNAMVALVEGAFGVLRGVVSAGVEILLGIVRGIPGAILGALGGLGDLLWEAGRDLLRGMINGLRSMAGALADAALAPVRAAVNAVKSFLHIGSPSKLFEGFGVNMGQGMAIGLDRSGDLVARAAAGMARVSADGAASVSGDSAGIGGGPTIIVQGALVAYDDVVRLARGGLADTGRYTGTAGVK